MSGKRDPLRSALLELGAADEGWTEERTRAKAMFPKKHPPAAKAHERYQTALLVVLNVARRLWDEKKRDEGKREGKS